jgi:hypothetical protein
MSLEAVIGAFASQVAELREATLLRVDGKFKIKTTLIQR